MDRRRHLPLLALAALFVGCVETHERPDATADAGAIDAGRADGATRDGGVPDSGAPDAGRSDGGRDAGWDACVATLETCDGTDQDCDGMVDEDSDATCVVANGTGRCEAAECVIDTCDSTHGDCDELYETGCEVETETSVADCGLCGHACGGTDACRDGVCDSERVIDVTAGEVHSCALRASGEVLCWGYNDEGQLGTGDLVERLLPTPVAGPTDFVDVEAGGRYTCGIRVGGTVACWGSNYRGQIGDGTTGGQRLIPTDTLPIGAPVVELAPSPGANGFVLARTSDGDVWGWGNNYYGQLGEGTRPTEALPIPMALGIANAVRIDASVVYSCAVSDDHHATCLGTAPVDLTGLRIDSIWIGDDHLCFTNTVGVFACGGRDVAGETGPFAMSGNPLDAATGSRLTCLVSSLGDLECRGALLPTSLPPDVASVDTAFLRTSALDRRARVWTWNGSALGDGSSGYVPYPLQANLYDGR
ncbi:MAG: RCC1 domain-containing protein [Sandaracinaceae bacterium]